MKPPNLCYKIQLLPTARIDLGDMIDYLSEYSPEIALKQYDRVIDKINTLKEQIVEIHRILHVKMDVTKHIK